MPKRQKQNEYNGVTYSIGDFVFCDLAGMYRILEFLPDPSKVRLVKVAHRDGKPSGKYQVIVKMRNLKLIRSSLDLANYEVEELSVIRKRFAGFSSIIEQCQT